MGLQEGHHTKLILERRVVVEHVAQCSHEPVLIGLLPRHLKSIGVTQSFHELSRALFGSACLNDRFAFPPSGAREEFGLGVGSYSRQSWWGSLYPGELCLPINLSEGSSNKGDQLSSYCIKGRPQSEFILFACLALLWTLLLVFSFVTPRSIVPSTPLE